MNVFLRLLNNLNLGINPATEDTLALVKAKADNLDLALTALRDALRGTGNKTLSDLEGHLASIDSDTLQLVTLLTSLNAKDFATQTTLAALNGKDFATSLKQDPLAKYRIVDIDKANPVKYYGFAALSGAWVILREDRSANPNTYRYVNTGAVDYPTAWTGRAALTYVYPYQLTSP